MSPAWCRAADHQPHRTALRPRDALGDYTLAFISAAVLGFVAAGFAMGITRLRLSNVASVVTQRR